VERLTRHEQNHVWQVGTAGSALLPGGIGLQRHGFCLQVPIASLILVSPVLSLVLQLVWRQVSCVSDATHHPPACSFS
jgi:hypothetical protein